MPLTVGSVTVDSSGNATGSGLSKEIYDARASLFVSSSVGGKQLVAAESEAIASAIVDHITANAVVLPTALAAPSGGGPVTGTGTIT